MNQILGDLLDAPGDSETVKGTHHVQRFQDQ
jgi:hypothetical protein